MLHHRIETVCSPDNRAGNRLQSLNEGRHTKGFDEVERKLLLFLQAGIDEDRWPAGWLMADDVIQRVAAVCAANGVKLWTEIEATRDRIVERFREMRIFDEPAELSRDVATLHKNRDAETAARLADRWRRLATHPVVARPGTPPLETLNRFHHVNAGRLDAAMNPKAGDRITQRQLVAARLYEHHVVREQIRLLETTELMQSAGCNEGVVSKSLKAFFGSRELYRQAADDPRYVQRMLSKHLPATYRRERAAFGERFADDISGDRVQAVSKTNKERKGNRRVSKKF